MTDDEPDAGEETNHLATGSGRLVDGISNIIEGMRHIKLFLKQWRARHTYIRFILDLVIGGVILSGLGRVAKVAYEFFFGRVVVAGNDLGTATTPLPLGLSVNILFILWLVTAYVGFIRLVRLRQRVVELENQSENTSS
ncbi:hypothetical protein [Halonotius sp. GCM10025705]|uniref:hypothetical protein n=1 Tax=Halonotius sp. GCM10025705 TaxID=3252678 RepID=UPI003609AD9E